MNLSTRNIVLIAGAVVVGLVIGLMYPIVGLLLMFPVLGYVVFVLLKNKGGAEADEATTSAAKQFIAAEGKGAIYVMRDAFIAGQQGMNITIDDAMTAQFRTGRFVKADVEPGEHSVLAQMASQTKGTAKTYTLSVAAGECVLLDAKIAMGALQGSVEFEEQRDAGLARAKLGKLKLVEWSTPEA